MTDHPGPWDRPPAAPQLSAPPPPQAQLAPRNRRGVAVLAALAVLALGVWGLMQLFPGRLSDSEDWGDVMRGAGMIAIVSASLAARRIGLKEGLRNILVWSAVAAVLLVGYSFRDPLAQAWTQVRSNIAPAYPVALGPHEMVLNQDANGSYYAIGQVNGQAVTFLIDTGSSDIVLSPADAGRLGVNLDALSFDDSFETANGVGRGARYEAESLKLGAISLSKVPMSINQQPMSTSLLGMAFFKRLDSFAFEGRQLRLKWHDGAG